MATRPAARAASFEGSGGAPHRLHLWRRGPSPVTSSAEGTRQLLASEPPLPPASPLMGSGARGALELGPYPGVAAAACYADAGLALGSSFRWRVHPLLTSDL